MWYELAYIETRQGVDKSNKVWQLAFGSGFKFNSSVMIAKRAGEIDEISWLRSCAVGAVGCHRRPVFQAKTCSTAAKNGWVGNATAAVGNWHCMVPYGRAVNAATWEHLYLTQPYISTACMQNMYTRPSQRQQATVFGVDAAWLPDSQGFPLPGKGIQS